MFVNPRLSTPRLQLSEKEICKRGQKLYLENNSVSKQRQGFLTPQPKRLAFENISPKQLFKNIRSGQKKAHSNVRNLQTLKEFFLNYDSPIVGPELSLQLCQDLCKNNSICPSGARKLGKGSFGCVVFALNKGSKLAIKVCKSVTQAAKEQNALGLKHNNIAKVLEVQEHCGNRLILMEYAGSCNLQRVLYDHTLVVHWNFQINCCIDVANALSHCHEHKIIHMDVKPANIIVGSNGLCKLSDFGCSLSLDEDLKGGKKSKPFKPILEGTVAYLAPELLKGDLPTYKADIYALGISFWQVLTRNVPYELEDPHVLIYKVVSKGYRPLVPKTSNSKEMLLYGLIRRCWSSDLAQRPTSEEVVQILKDF